MTVRKIFAENRLFSSAKKVVNHTSNKQKKMPKHLSTLFKVAENLMFLVN